MAISPMIIANLMRVCQCGDGYRCQRGPRTEAPTRVAGFGIYKVGTVCRGERRRNGGLTTESRLPSAVCGCRAVRVRSPPRHAAIFPFRCGRSLGIRPLGVGCATAVAAAAAAHGLCTPRLGAWRTSKGRRAATTTTGIYDLLPEGATEHTSSSGRSPRDGSGEAKEACALKMQDADADVGASRPHFGPSRASCLPPGAIAGDDGRQAADPRTRASSMRVRTLGAGNEGRKGGAHPRTCPAKLRTAEVRKVGGGCCCCIACAPLPRGGRAAPRDVPRGRGGAAGQAT